DPDFSLHVMKHPITVPNGLAFSPDNAYRNAPLHNLPLKKYGPGSPDGLAISEDGDLWVATFNGHRVLRIDAQSKEMKGEIEFP
ncbi:rRNA-processing protein cgr1, partial [Rhizina undulata]